MFEIVDAKQKIHANSMNNTINSMDIQFEYTLVNGMLHLTHE